MNCHDLNNCKEALDWKENHYVGSISFEVRMPNKNSGIFLSKFQLRSQKLYFVWPWNQKLLWKYVLFFKKKRYWAITLKSCQFVKSHMIPSFTYTVVWNALKSRGVRQHFYKKKAATVGQNGRLFALCNFFSFWLIKLWGTTY